MGVTMRYERYSAAVIRTPQWKAVRQIVKRRDGFRCVKCGAVGDLEVDHIKPVRTHPALAFDPQNLQTLCVSCHSRKTRIEIGLDPQNEARDAWRRLVRVLTPKSTEYENA